MTEMTRAEIYAMGVQTQQLGIRDAKELADICHYYFTTGPRVELALRSVENAQRALRDIE